MEERKSTNDQQQLVKSNEPTAKAIAHERSIMEQVLHFSSLDHFNQGPKQSGQTWSELFFEYFLHESQKKKEHIDDCLYFIKNFPEEGYTPQERLFVRRREDQKGIPAPADNTINWEETFYVNYILHKFEYTVEVSVRRRDENEQSPNFISGSNAPPTTPNNNNNQKDNTKKLTVIKRSSKRVYATPNKIRMDFKKKAEETQLTYPQLYYSVADFDDSWHDIVLHKDGEMVCVELFCTGDILSSGEQHKVRIFAGALDYSILHREFKNKRGMLSSVSRFGSDANNDMEFFNLQGPRGEGNAEMAVSPAGKSDSPQTPPSTTSRLLYYTGITAVSNVVKDVVSPTPSTLRCHLASMNLRWDKIMKDILRYVSVNKSVSKSNKQ